MLYSSENILKIIDELTASDINFEHFSEFNNFIFTSRADFNEAQEIIEDILGPFGYKLNKDTLTITLLFTKDMETDIDNYYNELVKDYSNKRISKESYLEELKILEDYLLDEKEVEFEEDLELEEDVDLQETYDDEELDKMVGKKYNQHKILNIYRRVKYNSPRLFAHTRCTNCGREKRVFLSNLITNPDKYGSCVCSDTNIEARMDNIEDLFDGSKRLSSNTSGYTGVSFVKNYRGEPYNKWRAYIEIDGKRTYLGDFSSKSKAIKARKAAAIKGLK